MPRATRRVEPKLITTAAQRWGRKKRAAEKQARAYEAAGDQFMAQLRRRDAKLYGQHLRKAKGLPAPEDTATEMQEWPGDFQWIRERGGDQTYRRSRANQAKVVQL